MFIPSIQGADASTASAIAAATTLTAAPDDYEVVRHMLFGSSGGVQATIHTLHVRGYAEPNDWSQPISTGRPREVMSILTKRLHLQK